MAAAIIYVCACDMSMFEITIYRQGYNYITLYNLPKFDVSHINFIYTRDTTTVVELFVTMCDSNYEEQDLHNTGGCTYIQVGR